MKKKKKTKSPSFNKRILLYCAMLMLPICILAGTLWGSDFIGYDVPLELLLVIYVSVGAIALPIGIRMWGSDKRYLRKNAFHVCRNCWHSLIGHMSEEKGICPECGHEYDHVADGKAWRNEYGIRKWY